MEIFAASPKGRVETFDRESAGTGAAGRGARAGS